jgi:prepilin-type N-terminal cleavage/methylation domain-containing protein
VIRLFARSERGFSLVETLAALVVFSIVTLGLVPVLLTSIRGSNISRSYTVGKNVALEAMERVRGLPFYIDAATQPRPVDVLDLYIPNLTAYNSTTCNGFFTTAVSCAATNYQVRSTPTVEAPGYLTTCTASGPSNCPTGIPAGVSVTYQSWFIQEETASDTDPETYNRVPLCAAGIVTACIPTNYNSTISGRDAPAKLLIEMIVTVRWTLQGRARSYDLRTVMGDRSFGDLKVKAEATIDYSINAIAGFLDPSSGSNRSEVNATAGYAQSRVEAKRTSIADTTVRAAEARLVNANTTPDPCSLASPGCPGDSIVAPASGATSTLLAPADVTGTALTQGFFSISHPQASIGAVAGADTTHIAAHTATTPHRALIAGGNPVAGGNFAFLNGPNPHFWIDNNREDTNAFDFQAGGNIRLFSVNPRGTNNITGSTSAVTNTIGSGVTSTATTAANDIRLFPTQTIRNRNNTYNGAVVVIENFTATVTCEATTNGVATTPTAGYSATLRYWFDPTENDVSDGSYQTVNLSLGGGADPLQTIRTAAMATSGQGSLVIDSNNDTRDVYLFPRFNNREYYLENWSSVRSVSPVVASQGRQVSVSLEPAITLETTDIQRGTSGGQVTGTSFGISIGSLRCSAEDRR